MELLQSWTAEGPTPERWHAFYVRVTREESVQADLSIPNQIARAKEIAALRSWRDYKIYVEPRHVSAELWTDKRPALRDLLDDARAGRVLAVCARHTDRLWRNNGIQARFLAVLRPAKVQLWDFTHEYDYKSAHGRFSLQVLGAASELEVNLTAERIREMKRGKAMKGRTGGGPPPYGYTSQSRCMAEYRAAGHDKDEAYALACRDIPIGKSWLIDEKEAAVVRLIFQLYSSPEYRFGCKRIAQHLNAHGYKTRNGLAWLSNYVIKLINNPVYAGFTTYDEASYENRTPSKAPRHKQKLFKGEHPPLLDAELWERVQAIKKDENTVKRVKGGPSASVFSLTGILRCPSCGSRMIGKWSHHSIRRYYICDRRHNGGPDLCSFPLLDAGALHREAWNWVHQILTSPSFVMEHVERLEQRLRAQEPESAQRIAAVEKRRDEIKAALAKYFARFEASSDEDQDDVLLDRVRELKAELKVVEAEIAELRKQVVPLPPRVSEEQVRRYLEKLRDRVDTRPEYQRVLFQEFKRSHEFSVKVVSRDRVRHVPGPAGERPRRRGSAARGGRGPPADDRG